MVLAACAGDRPLPAGTPSRRRSGLRRLVRRGRLTEFGDRYDLRHIRSVERFQSQVETFDYETFKPYVERMMAGVRSVTAPGRVRLFARSSGTTSDRSKYIPVTRESLWWNHTLGMRDVATLYAAAYPGTRVFDGKTLTLGGSCACEGRNLVGDLSALLIHETTFWSGWVPRAAHRDGDHSRLRREVRGDLPRMRRRTDHGLRGRAVVVILALMRRVLEFTGRKNLLEVWPRLELFAHGGVEFTPYRRMFEELLPSEGMHVHGDL